MPDIDGEIVVDGEVVEEHIPGLLTESFLHKCWWVTRDGREIKITEMADSHLRNAALFLMGMGYTTCTASENKRVLYLSLFRREWERRKYNGIKKWRAEGCVPVLEK